MRFGRGIDIRRIGLGAAAIAVASGAAVAISVVGTTSDSAMDTGAMAARVIEAKNRGVPAGVVTRFERVRAELAAGSADRWAGEYYEGDGLGENVTLALAPGTGFATTWFGCLGLYGANEGDAESIDERTLAFRFVLPNDSRKFGMFPATVRKVAWGERRYLIDPERYVNFVNAINVGLEPDSIAGGHLFLLARGDEAKPVTGLPDLPSEWLGQIREKPLLVTVSSVEPPIARGTAEMPRCLYRFRFDVPAGESLPVGFNLVSSDSSSNETATVLSVDKHKATAEVEMYEACAMVRNPPSAGWVFSSGAYSPRRDVASR